MSSRLPTRTLILSAALPLFVASSAASGQSYLFEDLTPGPIVGQDGWQQYAGAGDAGGATVVAFPSHNGRFTSTQSLQILNEDLRIGRPLGVSISGGRYRVGYDQFMRPRDEDPEPKPNDPAQSNLLHSISLNSVVGDGGANRRQIFQPYAQNGGGGVAAQNGFVDPDGLGGAAYGGASLIHDVPLVPRQWYRFEFTMDFDANTISDMQIYFIDEIGSAVLLPKGENSPEQVFFGNDNTAFFEPLNELGVRFTRGVVNPSPRDDEGWNIDNFTVEPILADQPYLVADFNFDGQVSVADVGILASNFGEDPVDPGGRAGGDANGDGQVTVADVGILATYFGQPQAPASLSGPGAFADVSPELAALVPEPGATLALLWMSGALLAGRRRRVAPGAGE